MSMDAPIVYRDGVQVIAVNAKNYSDIRYSVSFPDDLQPLLVLNQDQARELAAALTWIISEVDAKCGNSSFAPRPHQRIVKPQRKGGAS